MYFHESISYVFACVIFLHTSSYIRVSDIKLIQPESYRGKSGKKNHMEKNTDYLIM